MNHAILKLDSSRAYVLVESNVFENVVDKNSEWKVKITGTEETWFDTPKMYVEESITKVGDKFLAGKIRKILSYDDYMKKYPDTISRFDEVNEETDHKGFIRTVGASRMKTNSYDNWSIETVQYAVNPLRYTMTKLMQSDIA